LGRKEQEIENLRKEMLRLDETSEQTISIIKGDLERKEGEV